MAFEQTPPTPPPHSAAPHAAGASGVHASALSAALLELAHLTDAILAAVQGYKAKVVAAGFDEGPAEQMAADYHRELMRIALGKVGR